GMYMGPAAIGRALGLGAADQALAAQNGLLLGAILYGFWGQFPRRKLAALTAFVLFSGVSLVGWWLLRTEARLPVSLEHLPSHLDRWSGYWEFSSPIKQLFWVPNHALPGWWLAFLVLLAATDEVSLGWFGLSLATCFFWSPFAAIGAAPFAVWRF